MISYETRCKYRNNILKTINSNEEIWFLHMKYYTYEVSNTGKIRNIFTKKLLKGNMNPQGYTCVTIRDNNGMPKSKMLHRLVAEAIIPICHQLDEIEYEINHINSNKLDNDVLNLEWMTRRENLDHAVVTRRLKGLQAGEKNGRSKISDIEREEITVWYKLGDKIKDIAKAYNMSQTQIYRLTLKHKRNYDV